MPVSRYHLPAKRSAALALWLAVVTVSSGVMAAHALAQESEAAETPTADSGQQPEAPAGADGDAATEPDSEAASDSPNRPRSRVIRPDPSDLDDPLSARGPASQEAAASAEPAAPGSGTMVCVAGC
jgi:hypothetical protein